MANLAGAQHFVGEKLAALFNLSQLLMRHQSLPLERLREGQWRPRGICGAPVGAKEQDEEDEGEKGGNKFCACVHVCVCTRAINAAGRGSHKVMDHRLSVTERDQFTLTKWIQSQVVISYGNSKLIFHGRRCISRGYAVTFTNVTRHARLRLLEWWSRRANGENSDSSDALK